MPYYSTQLLQKKEEKNEIPMCSNSVDGHATSSSPNASVAAGGNHHDHASCSSFRKPKKPRIPKRGPGVAELEQILREQEDKCDAEKEKISINGRISSSTSLPLLRTTYLRPRSYNLASSSDSLPTTVPFFSDHNHNSALSNTRSTPPATTLPARNINVNDNLNDNSQFGGGSFSKGVFICKAGIYLPEESLLPVPWASYETSKREETSIRDSDFSFPVLVSKGLGHSKTVAPPTFQNSHGLGGHPSTVNKFPSSTVVSSSSRPSSSAAGVLYGHEEPPSSQKACHNHTSTLPEDDKMVGAKRPRPNFPLDNWPPAPPPPSLPFQNPAFHHRHIHRLDPSSSSINHGVVNLAPSSRDPILPSRSLELMLQKGVNDHGNHSGSGSCIAFGSPTTPLPSTENCQSDFSKFKQFSFQETKENSVEGLLGQNPSSSLSSGPEGSVHKKRCISFLLDPEEQSGDAAEAEASLSGLINEKFTEKGAEFIDLNLKL